MPAPVMPPERQCTANAKTTGNRCTRWAIPGGKVCATHGGNAPQVREAANARILTQTIKADSQATLAHYGVQVVDDPLEELSKLAQESRAMLTALGARVNALNDVETFDSKNTPQLRVVVGLYERAVDRTHKLLDSLVKHGYTERQVRLQEQEAMLVAGVIRRVLAGIGLTEAQQEQASTLLSEEFRALAQAGDLL